jgi:hypothetical protein
MQKKFDSLENWYEIEKPMLPDSALGVIHHYYNGSIWKALSSIYDTYDWHPWKFANPPMDIFNDFDIQKKFIEWLSDELNIDKRSIRNHHVIRYGGLELLNKHCGDISHVLESLYPHLEALNFSQVICKQSKPNMKFA